LKKFARGSVFPSIQLHTALVIAFAAGVAGIAGCGGSGSSTGSAATTSSTGTTSTTSTSTGSTSTGTTSTGTSTSTTSVSTSTESSGSSTATPPDAPTNFTMIHQGASDVVVTWTAATAGSYPVSYYKIYRNGKAYGTATTTTYTDSNAPNITTPGFGPQPFVPATVYTYTVSAVDSKGNEGPQQKQCVAWVYHDGVDSWNTSANNFNGGLKENASDTSGDPQNGAPSDIAITEYGGSNYFLPFSAAPFLHNMNPTTYAMELGMFNYMTIDLKPTIAGQTWTLTVISRVSPGDNYNSAVVTLGGSDETFGPQAQPGVWATYKIPFVNPSGSEDGQALQIGFGQYYGTLLGTALVVTQMVSGINVQGSSFLSGTGIVQGTSNGTGTYILSTGGSSGVAGTYLVAPNQAGIAIDTLITAQRTNMYKFELTDPRGNANDTYYIDNIGFTVQ